MQLSIPDRCQVCGEEFSEGDRVMASILVRVTRSGAQDIERDGECCLPPGHAEPCLGRGWKVRGTCGKPAKWIDRVRLHTIRKPKNGEMRIQVLSGGKRWGAHEQCLSG
jgi:hypothetical protein